MKVWQTSGHVAHACNPGIGMADVEDPVFEVNLGYVLKAYLKRQNETKGTRWQFRLPGECS